MKKWFKATSRTNSLPSIQPALLHATRCFALATLTLVAACSTDGPPPSTIDPLEQNAINALEMKMPGEADFAMLAALARYQSLDDLAGQWRMHFALITTALATEDTSRVQAHAELLSEIADQLNTRTVRYKTDLVLGRLNDDSSYFDRALANAGNKIDEAVARTYLGQTTAALALLDDTGTDQPGDRAFVYYRYAQAHQSVTHYRLALQAYRLAEDSRGVADSLMSIAQLEAQQNRSTVAVTLARRAQRVLQSIGDHARAENIQAWIDNL